MKSAMTNFEEPAGIALLVSSLIGKSGVNGTIIGAESGWEPSSMEIWNF